MTNQLVPVFNGAISNETILLCNARDLHEFLGVRRDFSTWIKNRIADYGFALGVDFLLVHQNGGIKKVRGGDRRSKDYHLTLDTAKELAMVERNDKGRQVRRYFIECEKQLRQKEMPTNPPAETEEKLTLSITRSELCSLCWVWAAAEYMRETMYATYPALEAIKSSLAPTFYSMGSEYQLTLEAGRKILERETRSLDPHPYAIEDANWRSVLPRLREGWPVL
ncbi:antA/AntB antirepressor family protein [Serratia symbiotica]|uniref:antA/AntB antirepressor family protein n=1 Tax=Serratia symbiotica TaxID=138074 RepID=UPI001CF09593|nr:antA/AntB antirepressor family protein [Serratia symbiotica]